MKEVKEGVIASKIAAQAADSAKRMAKAWNMELKMARARRDFDWERQFELHLTMKNPENIGCNVQLKKKTCAQCAANTAP